MADLKNTALVLAEDLRKAPAASPQPGGGSLHRNLPEELRKRFIDFRTALFTAGIFDPVLVRFDSATAPAASNAEIADQLDAVAQMLA